MDVDVTPKKIPSLKSGFCWSILCDIFWKFENWSTGSLRKCVSFLPPSKGRKVVATVCMVQTVSLLLPVDYNSFPQTFSGPIFKIPTNITYYGPTQPRNH